MAVIIDDVSVTFNEFLLLPGLTTKEHRASSVSLKTPIQRFNPKHGLKRHLNSPLVSSAMQAVTGDNLAIALARKGGCGFTFCSQTIQEQSEMVRRVKEHKAGFVESDSNLAPEATLADAVKLRNKTGHSTIAITEGGKSDGRLLGLLTSKDFWEFKDELSNCVKNYYTPVDRLVMAKEGISLQDATEMLWKSKKECLPVVDASEKLKALVFRRDYFDHKSNPDELTDDHKRLFVGAALNTFDYMERAKALLEEGVDCLCLDSSDGHSQWQGDALRELRKAFGEDLVVGGGNVVTKEGFRYLAEAGADFVKVGIGGGSICITREQKGIGRGQASSIIEVAAERERYLKETGIYVPICSDGAINNDTHVIIALALGADFIMMGKYFAMTEESPTAKVRYRGRLYKPYWGEGSNRARNWQRYKQTDENALLFEEGVDAYVPYSGPLAEKVDTTLAKLRSTFCNLGVLDIKELHQNARLTRISPMTLVEGGTSSVERLDNTQSE